ncbi:MAG: ABC transporter ATP-binding protein [Betaproteobacteria bacterium]
MGEAALVVSRVCKTFAGPRPRAVFDGVSLEVGAGEYVAITGDSGVGKSTLLNLMAGLDQPDSGLVAVDGVDLSTLDDDGLTRLRRNRIGFVFQAFHVLPYLDVARNVGLPLLLAGADAAAGRSRVQEMLEAVGLGDRGNALPRELSGGELQRVAIARALIHRPRLLLADEPTGNLDPDTAAGIIGLLRSSLRESGAAGVLVTHSARAARSADRILRLTAIGLETVPHPAVAPA